MSSRRSSVAFLLTTACLGGAASADVVRVAPEFRGGFDAADLSADVGAAVPDSAPAALPDAARTRVFDVFAPLGGGSSFLAIGPATGGLYRGLDTDLFAALDPWSALLLNVHATYDVGLGIGPDGSIASPIDLADVVVSNGSASDDANDVLAPFALPGADPLGASEDLAAVVAPTLPPVASPVPGPGAIGVVLIATARFRRRRRSA